MQAPTEPLTVPTWMVWAVRGVLTLNGTVAAVMVAQYASTSGEWLDVALVAVIIAASAFAVIRAHRVVPVTVACIVAMLGLALVPPMWLLALVPPLLLTGNARRHRRGRGSRPDTTPPPDEDAP